jgi:hypothetical protein
MPVPLIHAVTEAKALGTVYLRTALLLASVRSSDTSDAGLNRSTQADILLAASRHKRQRYMFAH